MACLAAVKGMAFAEDEKDNNPWSGLSGQATLKAALAAAVDAEGTGLNLKMWDTLVNRAGVVVCAAAVGGTNRGSQCPGSRVIPARKADTASAFSLDASAAGGVNGGPLVLSTANYSAAIQPGGSPPGLQESILVNTAVAYKGPSARYGTSNDPMVGEKFGGVNVFGGGLALYDVNRKLAGGDTSCSDHNIAWRARRNLNVDYLLGAIPGVAQLFAGKTGPSRQYPL